MGDAGMPRSLAESLENTKVTYVQLGASGLRVSIPILGAMSFGHKDWQPWVIDDEAEVDKLLIGAYDRGLNTWDTANVYSNGESERMIGRVIKKHNIPRHKLVLLSKCFGTVGEEPGVVHIKYPEQIKNSKDYVNQGGLSRAAIFNAVNASLERLGTDYMDLLQIHRFDKSVPVEETMKALHDLVQSGKVRYIGTCLIPFQYHETGLYHPGKFSRTVVLTYVCYRRVLYVGLSVRQTPGRRRKAQLDQVRLNAESLQSLLPGRRARNEPILPRDWRRLDPMGATVPWSSRTTSRHRCHRT